jgi:sugar phosphate permease
MPPINRHENRRHNRGAIASCDAVGRAIGVLSQGMLMYGLEYYGDWAWRVHNIFAGCCAILLFWCVFWRRGKEKEGALRATLAHSHHSYLAKTTHTYRRPKIQKAC